MPRKKIGFRDVPNLPPRLEYEYHELIDVLNSYRAFINHNVIEAENIAKRMKRLLEHIERFETKFRNGFDDNELIQDFLLFTELRRKDRLEKFKAFTERRAEEKKKDGGKEIIIEKVSCKKWR